MEIRALILVSSATSGSTAESQFSAMPLPLLDVAGRSALERLSERLLSQGVSRVTGVIEGDSEPLRSAVALSAGMERQIVPADRFWRAGENAFNDMGQGTTDFVLLIRMGAYIELDIEK